MTKLRLARAEEYPMLDLLADSKNIGKPVYGLCFVFEEDGVIKGFVNGRLVGLIDTIVSDTPQTASRLFSAIEAVLLSQAQDQIAFAENPNVGSLLLSQSWDKIQSSVFIKRR